jgi:hypothetical protein
MPISTAGKNKMLDALLNPAGFVSLHSAYPGDTGANEIAGGSPAYARKAKTWNSAGSSTVDDSNQPVLDVPAATTVGFIGFWSLVTAGVFYGYAPAGGTPLRYTADAATDFITSVAHGLVNGDNVVFMNGAAPAGLTEGTVYFVVNKTTDTFQVALTAGGSAINITATAQPASSRVSKIVQEVFAAQGTYTQTDADFDLLDT